MYRKLKAEEIIELINLRSMSPYSDGIVQVYVRITNNFYKVFPRNYVDIFMRQIWSHMRTVQPSHLQQECPVCSEDLPFILKNMTLQDVMFALDADRTIVDAQPILVASVPQNDVIKSTIPQPISEQPKIMKSSQDLETIFNLTDEDLIEVVKKGIMYECDKSIFYIKEKPGRTIFRRYCGMIPFLRYISNNIENMYPRFVLDIVFSNLDKDGKGIISVNYYDMKTDYKEAKHLIDLKFPEDIDIIINPPTITSDQPQK